MNEEISIVESGTKYTAEYVVVDDSLTIFLPDGSERSSQLRNLKPEFVAKTHLKSYIRLKRKSSFTSSLKEVN